MKIINSKLHGILDYVVSVMLIISPWIFGFANGKPQMWIPIILGVSSILYSLFTNYEMGPWKIFPFKTHLTFDALSGVLLATSPWIFGFADDVFVPHLVFGILELCVVALTKTRTSTGFASMTRKPAL